MILDTESLTGGLRVSYFKPDGSLAVRDFRIPEPTDWAICGQNDPKRDPAFRNWDGRAVKRKRVQYMNKFSMLEFMHNLPDADKADITAQNFPRMQSIDIETEVIDGFPDPAVARERVTVIAVSTEDNRTVVMGWKPMTPELEAAAREMYVEHLKPFGEWKLRYQLYANEHDMLTAFVTKVLPKCSMVIGWNMNGFDWPYIYNRCRRLGIDVAQASPSGKTATRRTQDGSELEIPVHVGVLDYMEIYKKWDMTVKIKESNSLDFVANAVLGSTKMKYPGTLQELYEKDYDKYVAYNAIDSALVTLIHRRLHTSDAAFAVASMCNLSVYKASSPVNLTEALLWKGYYERNMVIADQRMDAARGDYEGAYVKKPEVGFYNAVTCYDYASLYPSIMRQFNISPESYVEKATDAARQETLRKAGNIVSVTGATYRPEESVMKGILTKLYADRRKFKDVHLEIERFLGRRTKK